MFSALCSWSLTEVGGTEEEEEDEALLSLLPDGICKRCTGRRAKAIAQPMSAVVLKHVGPLNEKAGCYAAVGRLLWEAVAAGSLRLRGDR